MDEILKRVSQRTDIDIKTIQKVAELFLANLDKTIYFERNINLYRMMYIYNYKTPLHFDDKVCSVIEKRYMKRKKKRAIESIVKPPYRGFKRTNGVL